MTLLTKRPWSSYRMKREIPLMNGIYFIGDAANLLI